MRSVTRERLTHLLRGAGLLVACLALWATFRHVDGERLRAVLDRGFSIALLIVVPFGLINLVDAKGWQFVLSRLGARVRLGDVYVTQLAGEAAILSLPLGFAVSEPLRPFLLGRRARVSIDTAVASTLARKTFLILAEGLVVALACLLGAATFHKVSEHLLGVSGLEWLTLFVAVLLCGIGFGMALLLRRGTLATRVLGALRGFRLGRLVHYVDRRGTAFTATDAALARFFSSNPWQLLPGLGWYALVWLLEAVEAYVVLQVLGADVTFVEALSAEAALAFLRSVVVFLPAGLGVQDLGYVLFLQALGVPDALVLGAAFSIVKRSKEALWIAVGYGCLFLSKQAPARTVVEVAT